MCNCQNLFEAADAAPAEDPELHRSAGFLQSIGYSIGVPFFRDPFRLCRAGSLGGLVPWILLWNRTMPLLALSATTSAATFMSFGFQPRSLNYQTGWATGLKPS